MPHISYFEVPQQYKLEQILRMLSKPMTLKQVTEGSRSLEIYDVAYTINGFEKKGYVERIKRLFRRDLYKVTKRGLEEADNLHRQVFPPDVGVSII